ncbi:MAG TPA: hypothetical protein VJK03_00145 [Candidatus Nanoarchaeia archaeon]|nr:hypothetical protein [Candidatus Nanoarchaeia archaeon]
MDKRAQVAETMTWATATIVILVMTFIFIAAAALLAKTKGVGSPLDFASNESEVPTQEMLFAILSFSSGSANIKESIAAGQYTEVREQAQRALTEFKQNDIQCKFTVRDRAREGIVVTIGTASGSTSASAIIGEREARLQC